MRKSLWAAVLAGAACLVSFRSTYEPDLWWHLAQGREVAAGRLVRTNLFSFAYRNYPQPYTSWLFDLGAYGLYTRLGAAAIQTAQALAIAAALGTVAAACRVRSSTAATIAAIAVGWVILEPRALPRPYLLSWLGLAACVYLIERARADHSSRPLFWAPLVIAVWANIHVECLFGVALIGLFGLFEWLFPRDLPREHAVRVIGVSAVALLATAANPYGFGLLQYLYENTFVPQVLSIAELQPPYYPNYRGFFAWTMAGAILVALRWRRLTPSEIPAAAIFAFMGWGYLRLTPLLFLVTAPLVARCFDDLLQGARRRSLAAIASVAAALLLSRVPVPTLVRQLHAGGNALTPPALFSETAMQFARDRGLVGPVFTSINLGGYVAWKLYPSAQIFVDARLQAYPPAHFRAIVEASSDPAAWDAMTSGVDWAVLSLPRVNPLSGVGRFDAARWGTAYRDEAIEIVVRRSGRYGNLAGGS